MEKILAIRGDIFDSNRVIKILESLGGYNRHNISCAYYDYFYYIDSNGDITCIAQDKMLITKFNTHTIGSFLEMYPYNIGDNVILTSKIPVKITNMYIDDDAIVVYEGHTDNGIIISPIPVSQIISKLNSEDEPEDVSADKSKAPVLKGSDYGLTEHGYTIPDGYEFVEVRKDFCDRDEIVLRKKQPEPVELDKACKVFREIFTELCPGAVGYDKVIADWENKFRKRLRESYESENNS